MLDQNDRLKMAELMERDKDFRDIISKLLENQRFTVSQISHEIGNPLTLVYSSLQLIESSHPEVKDFRYWNDTMNDLKFLRNLLKDLSAFNSSETFTFTSVDLAGLLDEVRSGFEAKLSDTQKTLTFIIQEKHPHIKGDSTKLRQAITNLIVNALDAVSETGTVIVKLCSSDQTVKIQVCDNGCGIPKEHLSSIFTPFTTFKSNGTGLGLAITQRIVQAHKGSVTVESAPGTGTVFTLAFPLAPQI